MCQLDDKSSAIAANEEEDEKDGNSHIEGGIGSLINIEIEGAPTRSLKQQEIGILATSPRFMRISPYSIASQ